MALKIDSEWIEVEPDVQPEFDATYGQLGININDAWLTEFETQNGMRGKRLETPAYPLAEWIAENWWALLYEPEKGTNSRKEPAFKSRHWFGTARDGFALPNLWLYSMGGGAVETQCEPYFFQHSRLLLRADTRDKLDVTEVEKSLELFVLSVIERLDAKGRSETLLHQIWQEYKSLEVDERKFCRLLGALGLSPYASDHGIEELLTKVLADASEQVTEDFCEAAEEGDIYEAAGDMLRSLNELSSEPQLDLSSLFRIDHPRSHKPWRTGVMAANSVREKFDIDPLDRSGGTKFLDLIGAGDIVLGEQGHRDIEEPAVHGSLRRDNAFLQMNLIRKRPEARRFDAARSCFLAWEQVSGGDRLVTRARVKDQQASRAFAAELLAPIQYIKNNVSNNVLSTYRASGIGEDLNISPQVVMWQAENNNIEVVGGRRMTRG